MDVKFHKYTDLLKIVGVQVLQFLILPSCQFSQVVIFISFTNTTSFTNFQYLLHSNSVSVLEDSQQLIDRSHMSVVSETCLGIRCWTDLVA